jgi:hypothetical protein
MTRHGTSIILLIALLLGLSSCATYRSSYFTRSDNAPVIFAHLRLTPRIFAYKDARGLTDRVLKDAFIVTMRVQDSASHYEDYQWKQGQKAIDSLANRFLQKVSDAFVVDSLVLYETPSESAPIVLLPDKSNFSPRRDDYLTLKFGETTFQRSTVRLSAVLHVTRGGLSPTADSVVFQMWRVEIEERGLLMFSSGNQGY